MQTILSYNQVEKTASEMLANGIRPTVRGVMSVIGGKTETVSKYLRDFFEKRDQEVASMANQIGSTEIAKLIASEIHTLVEKRTHEIAGVAQRQKQQINELVELLEAKQEEINQITSQSQSLIEQTQSEAQAKIDTLMNQLNQAKQAEHDAAHKIQAAQDKATTLIEAADARAHKYETEALTYRDEIQKLNIEKARYQVEQKECMSVRTKYEKLVELQNQTHSELIEARAEQRALNKDLARLEKENQNLTTQFNTTKSLSD
ncbi:DNA-binding protein [Thiomicrospira microaerophila]|uniref:DNA-binding protein n=1 Tax=Thiomicrospira microaerophila TaxID=406020 RepID=UPI0006992364|nr:DNA-binding protein [Thiomicrospira microaerophila]